MKPLLAILSIALTACTPSPPPLAVGNYCSEILRSHNCISGSVVCYAPLPALLAVPACFDGKSIKVSGFVAHQTEGTRLYLSKDSASNYFFDQSIRLELVPGSPGESVFLGKDRYLGVFGTFHASTPDGIGKLLVSRPGHVVTGASDGA
jgi:hypothetical protein